jgi:hypothetical protein
LNDNKIIMPPTCTESAKRHTSASTDPTTTAATTAKSTTTTSSTVVCSDGCRSRNTHPYECPTHGASASYKAAILARTTDPQRAAILERAKRIPKGRFHEPHFQYEGDTVVIWNIMEFRRHREWRHETRKKTARKRKWCETYNGGTVRIQSSRPRFRRILRQLYQQLLLDSSNNDDAAAATHQPKESS